MTGRKCSNCKHYEPAPIWRKGWCRNSLLYSPQQSHLVGEDDLDCERGMGNYWEPDAGLLSGTLADNTQQPGVQPLHFYPGSVPPKRPDAPATIYTVSGSSGYGVDPDDDLPPPGPGNRITTPGGRERELSYYSDERYWTDYLRIALPIVGVILILLLFWFWASAFLGDDDDGGDLGAGADATGTRPTLPVIGASPSTTERAGAGNTPIVVLTPTGSAQQPGTTGQTPQPDVPATGGGEIVVGSTVQVAGTGADGANLRADSSTESEVVDVLLDGTQLTVIGGPIDDGTYTWWNVQNDAVSGWLVADFLEVTQ